MRVMSVQSVYPLLLDSNSHKSDDYFARDHCMCSASIDLVQDTKCVSESSQQPLPCGV